MHVVTLVRREANRWRFWEATIDGPLIEIATGPVGAEGEAEYQQFASGDAAYEWLEREVTQRRAEGYVDPERRQEAAAMGPAKANRNHELEAKLVAEPDDVDTYLVYADWLESAGDPRGRLITLHHRLERDPDNGELAGAESELLLHYADHFFPEHGPRSALEAVWYLGFIRRAVIGSVRSLQRLLEHPSAVLLRELHIGGAVERASFASAILGAQPMPTLRQLRVTLGAGEPLPAELWARLPGLEHVLIGGEGALDRADTSKWKSLEITGGGELSSDTIELLGQPRWPSLATLSIDLGSHPAEDFSVFFDGGAMPALRDLSVVVEPGMIPMVVASKLTSQLDVLRLRDCELTDEDVASLSAHGGSLAHLATLDLSNNYLSSPATARLRGLARHVVTAPQNEHDDEFDDDYYEDEYYGEGSWDQYDDETFSADVVPVYEQDPDEPEDESALELDKTFERGVVGFDHDD